MTVDPTIHAHRHFDLLPLSSFCRGLLGRLIRLCCCFGLAVLLVLTSYSVRGVGGSQSEPWTRLHCSEWHWCEPVALSAGQSGAPVSSKACAHGS